MLAKLSTKFPQDRHNTTEKKENTQRTRSNEHKRMDRH